jgi:hypothetical protein
VLFNSDLNPKLIDNESTSFYGIELNLNALTSRIKTVTEYNLEIEELQKMISELQNSISRINDEKETNIQILKTKFKKKLNELKEVIVENEYKEVQYEENLKRNKVVFDEWLGKAQSEKERILLNLESELDKITSQKIKAQEQIDIIQKGIERKVTLKEKERDTEIVNLNVTRERKIGFR